MGDMLLFLCAAWMALSSDARPDVSITSSCTVDELLPHSTPAGANSLSPEWSDQNTARDPYGCDCSFSRARYFCPSREKNQGYREWVPRAVSEGVCKSVTRSHLSEAPLPPEFKVLVYGNSHLRQVVEALMCIFPDKVEEKVVSFSEVSKEGVQKVRGNTTCRYSADEQWDDLVENKCLLEEDVGGAGKECSDDIGEFFMTNGAVLHYYMSDSDKNKSIRDALSFHNDGPWSDYDAVFANSGNKPYMSEESVLTSAGELQQAGVPFFWLSQYDGTGDINAWEASHVSRFHESGARYVDIRTMTHGLRPLTKGVIEPAEQNQKKGALRDDTFLIWNGGDPHFCLPGPPNEMALLLLKLMWAVHQS